MALNQNYQTNLIEILDNLDKETNWKQTNDIDHDFNEISTDFNDLTTNFAALNPDFSDFNNITNKFTTTTNNIEDINQNRIQHALQYETNTLEDFDCVECVEFVEPIPDLTAKDLIIKEVIEDLILRTFCFDSIDTTDKNNETQLLTIEKPRMRRCSSLKSVKTTTSEANEQKNCKKIVRFADVLGLDLADVRTYLDDIPRVPSSAYKDLINCEVESCCPRNTTRNLLAMFQQPVTLPNFIAKVTMAMVLLENAYVDDPVSFCVKGAVRVRNISFHKNVIIRYTMDKWCRSNDIEATYVANSHDGFTDKFQFVLYAYGLDIGDKLEFAVRYKVDGQEFWDNNNGSNYCFQCLPVDVPQALPMTPGIHEQFVTFYYDDQPAETTESNTIPKLSVFECDDGETMDANCQRQRSQGQLSSAEVQQIIALSLGKKHNMAGVASTQGNPKPEVVLFCVVLFLSIVMFYAKRILF